MCCLKNEFVVRPRLKGNSAVKTNRAQISIHTFNKLLPKNLGPNNFSKGETARQRSRIIQISTPCSFPCRCKSDQRQECDVIAYFFIAGIRNAYRCGIQISKTRSCYKQNAALCCAIVHKWQSKNQMDGYKLSQVAKWAAQRYLVAKYTSRTLVIVVIHTSVALTLHLIALKQIPD